MDCVNVFRHSFARYVNRRPSSLSYICRCRVSNYSVKKKTVSSKARRRDGHEISLRNVFWEERMHTTPKPPLWIQHVGGSTKHSLGKSSKNTLTLAEKRIAAIAFITMIIAVVSFKIVFGGKAQKMQENGDSETSVTV